VRRAALLLLCVWGACAGARERDASLLPRGETDGRIQEACTVTARTCSRCHEIDRVLVAHIDGPEGWRTLVERMRLMRSSAMTEHEADEAVTCLVYRAYGRRGLEALAPAGGGR
jgi:hypothetical protein